MAELTFRQASREDTGLILEFIKKLADYEHRLDEVIATEEDLEKWIFDKEHANVIFALEDGKEIGFALYFLSFSTYIGNANLHLEDLFIDPEYRGKGHGSKIIKQMCKYLDEHKQDCYLETHKEENIKIYEHYGFELLEVSKIPKTDIVQYSMLRKVKKG